MFLCLFFNRYSAVSHNLFAGRNNHQSHYRPKMEQYVDPAPNLKLEVQHGGNSCSTEKWE